MEDLPMNSGGYTIENGTDTGGISYAMVGVIVVAMVSAVVMCAFWIQVSDRLNANDAYRTKVIREQRDAYREACEYNYGNRTGLHEWIRQKNLKPPAELMRLRQCVLLPDTEQVPPVEDRK